MRIAITGGIGSGKSVVSHLLRIMGYPVYDTDLEARRLMNTSAEIRQNIEAAFGAGLYAKDGLDRAALARIVFKDAQALQRLNAIVHPVVRRHFGTWADSQSAPLVFMESAILYESGFHDLVDRVWLVTAPDEVRVHRVMCRNGMTEAEVRQRIASQMSDTERMQYRPAVIRNDGITPLIPEVLRLLNESGERKNR